MISVTAALDDREIVAAYRILNNEGSPCNEVRGSPLL